MPRPSATPFYRLDAQTGWRQGEHSQAVLEDPVSSRLRLGRPGDFAIAPDEPFGSFGGMTLPRGVTVNPLGQLLLADPTQHRILYFDNNPAASAPVRPLWRNSEPAATSDPALDHPLFAERPGTPDPYHLHHPRDLLFLRDGSLAVADSGHQRVLIFAWPGLRLLHQHDLTDSEPLALAQDSCQQLYVISARADGAGQLQRLTRQGIWDLAWSAEGLALHSPKALAFDNEDNLLILDATGLQQLSPSGAVRRIDRKSAAVFERRHPIPPLALVDGVLTYPQIDKPDCETLQLQGLAVDRHGYLQGTQLPLLARPRAVRLPRAGVYISQQLDSGVLSSQWHRVVLNAELPGSARVLLATYTSDRPLEPYEVADIHWPEPTVIGAEAPHQQQELLVQSGPGRYMHLRLELLGDGYSTPEIRDIQVFALRDSSLRYLPAPFHQDPESAQFLDRLLSYFDTLQEEIRFVMRDFTRYLDPTGVPAGEFLDWLGGWFDWRFLAQWPDHLRRDMIRQSISYFQQRGTLQGLRQMVQWHTGLRGDQPQIIEHYRLRNYSGLQQRSSAEAYPLFVGERPLTPAEDQISHWFTLVLPAYAAADEAALALLERVVEAQKPAHTAFQLRLIQPGVRIGRQSSIGLDTWLGQCPNAPLGAMALGQSSTLVSPATQGLTSIHTAINKDHAHGH